MVGWWGAVSYGKVAVLSLIEHKESSHERPMGLVFERVMQSFRDSLAESASPASPVRMISFDFHRFVRLHKRLAVAPPLHRLPLSRHTSTILSLHYFTAPLP